MTWNVLWRSSLGSKAATKLKHLLASDIELIIETAKEKALDHKDWFQILVDGGPSEDLLNGARLEHVVIPYVGLNKDLRTKLLARPWLKLYNSHFNDAFVAQHALAMLLTCSNRLVEADQSLRKGNWTIRKDDGFFSMFLPGKTALLLGYGAIAKEIEKRLRCLGMEISILRRHPQKKVSVKEYAPEELHQALGEADIIIVSLPSTPETQNMLDEAAFKVMKKGSILINVGRGDVIDQHALYRALKSEHLLGAGLDVWWNYPKDDAERSYTFPADAPLHELPNLVMSPHRAALVDDWDETSFRDVAKTLNAIAQARTRNLVDVARGY